MELRQLLQKVIAFGASDLHISSERPPIVRRDGILEPIGSSPLSTDHVNHMLTSILSAEQIEQFDLNKELDLAIDTPEGRFRLNAFINRLGNAFVCHRI